MFPNRSALLIAPQCHLGLTAYEMLALRRKGSSANGSFAATAARRTVAVCLASSPLPQRVFISVNLFLSSSTQLGSLPVERATCCILALAKCGFLLLERPVLLRPPGA
jgi:hypothetical protein